MVRQQRDDAGGLGRLDEEGGPRAAVPGEAVRLRERRDAAAGALGHVRLGRRDAVHGARAEPRADAVDQHRQRRRALLPHAGLPGLHRLCARRREDHPLDPEAGVDPVQPLREEASEVARLASGGGAAGAQRRMAAVHADAEEVKDACALPAPGQPRAEFAREPGERALDARAVRDRLGEDEPCADDLRCLDGDQALERLPSQLREARDHLRAEAQGERGARRGHQVADPLQT